MAWEFLYLLTDLNCHYISWKLSWQISYGWDSCLPNSCWTLRRYHRYQLVTIDITNLAIVTTWRIYHQLKNNLKNYILHQMLSVLLDAMANSLMFTSFQIEQSSGKRFWKYGGQWWRWYLLWAIIRLPNLYCLNFKHRAETWQLAPPYRYQYQHDVFETLGEDCLAICECLKRMPALASVIRWSQLPRFRAWLSFQRDKFGNRLISPITDHHQWPPDLSDHSSLDFSIWNKVNMELLKNQSTVSHSSDPSARIVKRKLLKECPLDSSVFRFSPDIVLHAIKYIGNSFAVGPDGLTIHLLKNLSSR